MKHQRISPVDMATDQPEKQPSILFDPAIERVAEISEEQRWNALRGITHLAGRNGWPVEDVREIVCALGLVEVEKRTEESEPVQRDAILAAVDHPDRMVPCPTCHAPPGAMCTAYNGVRTNSYPRGHIGRHRRAEERS